MSYPAIVSEILGTNNYLVDSDIGPKHVSGDVLSRASDTATAVTTTDTETETELLSDTDTFEDDSISVSSDLSEDLDELYAPHIVGGGNNIMQRPRRGQREIANLGNVPQHESRLRSGRI